MLIKTTKKATDLAPEGEYPAELKQVTYKNENKKCILHFETGPHGHKHLVPKEGPSSLDAGPLRKDLELLNGAGFTVRQVEEGVDPEKFLGHRCRALVVHKRTSGGRVVAVISVLLPLETGPTKPAPGAAPTVGPQAEAVAQPSAVEPGQGSPEAATSE